MWVTLPGCVRVCAPFAPLCCVPARPRASRRSNTSQHISCSPSSPRSSAPPLTAHDFRDSDTSRRPRVQPSAYRCPLLCRAKAMSLITLGLHQVGTARAGSPRSTAPNRRRCVLWCAVERIASAYTMLYTACPVADLDNTLYGAARPGAKGQRCFNPDDKVKEEEGASAQHHAM